MYHIEIMQGDPPAFSMMLQEGKGQWLFWLYPAFKTRVRGVLQMHLYWLVLLSAALQRHHLIGNDHQNMFGLICFSLSQLCQLFPQWLGMPGVSLALPPENFHGNTALATSCLYWHIPCELCETLQLWPRALVGSVVVKWGMWLHSVQVGWKDAQWL